MDFIIFNFRWSFGTFFEFLSFVAFLLEFIINYIFLHVCSFYFILAIYHFYVLILVLIILVLQVNKIWEWHLAEIKLFLYIL